MPASIADQQHSTNNHRITISKAYILPCLQGKADNTEHDAKQKPITVAFSQYLTYNKSSFGKIRMYRYGWGIFTSLWGPSGTYTEWIEYRDDISVKDDKIVYEHGASYIHLNMNKVSKNSSHIEGPLKAFSSGKYIIPATMKTRGVIELPWSNVFNPFDWLYDRDDPSFARSEATDKDATCHAKEKGYELRISAKS